MMQVSPNNDMGMTYKGTLGLIHGIVSNVGQTGGSQYWTPHKISGPRPWICALVLLNKKQTTTHSAATFLLVLVTNWLAIYEYLHALFAVLPGG